MLRIPSIFLQNCGIFLYYFTREKEAGKSRDNFQTLYGSYMGVFSYYFINDQEALILFPNIVWK